jgi:hypothetical protein
LSLDDYAISAILEKVENLLDSVHRTNWTEFQVNNVKFGKLASYEFCLHHKQVSRVIPSELFDEYLNYLRTTLISYFGGIELLRFTNPDVVIFYNSLYSINSGFEQAAHQLGIQTYTIQGGPHLVDRSKTLTLFKSSRNLYEIPYSDSWFEYSKRPLTSNKVNEVHRHLIGLLDGASPWAYSAPVGSNNSSKFPRNAILVLTSSEDELAAGRLVEAFPKLPIRAGFSSQTEWLKSILDIARELQHLNFIIRIHPRMAPNKRDGNTSPFIGIIDQLVQSASSNVFINFPTDEVSLYDLVGNTSLALNYGSSAGIELLCFGIQVINAISQDFLVAPIDISKNASNKEELQREIVDSYGLEIEPKFISKAYRWYSFQFNRSARFIFENDVATFGHIRPKKPGIRLKLWNTAVRLVITRLPTFLERRQIKTTKSDIAQLRDFESVLVKGLSGLHEIPSDTELDGNDELMMINQSINQLRRKIGNL